MTSGWHSINANHGKKLVGLRITGKTVIIRVMDFYLRDGGLIRENWVPIYILHILKQIDVGVLNIIRDKNNSFQVL